MTQTSSVDQVRRMTDDEATNMRLELWWLREMELLQGLVDTGVLSGPSIGMAARGLWNMAYRAGADAAGTKALLEAADEAEQMVFAGNDLRESIARWLRIRAAYRPSPDSEPRG